VALATFFYFERRRLDFSETLSAAIAVSVDETKAARAETSGDASPCAASSDGGAKETAASDDVGSEENVLLWRFDAPKSTLESASRFPLPSVKTSDDSGVVLAKIGAGDVRAWTVVSLSDDEEKTP
ncbi:MAG: hypothetical protein IKU86_13010, partial [Thermoguttaceae bacterium]|nr:hypothetical protein [Thermoguttaceae bacterium]